jgi:hypothetical protein
MLKPKSATSAIAAKRTFTEIYSSPNAATRRML